MTIQKEAVHNVARSGLISKEGGRTPEMRASELEDSVDKATVMQHCLNLCQRQYRLVYDPKQLLPHWSH